ncbi:MAG: penicillin-binding transpeptidase domain-containing protein [bacterium]|nr:penicillin-binding transpeptidase domain-containing protein [bacterium]
MWWMRRRLRRSGKIKSEIHPDEIFVDSQNTQEFNRDQFEGRIEQPISRRVFLFFGGVLTLLFVGLFVRAGDLQLVRGVAYAQQAKNNQLSQKIIFADRGTLVDRTGVLLAYNVRLPAGQAGASLTDDFASRVYADFHGLSHTIGYVQPPAKDSSGVYFRTVFLGIDGAERAFDALLGGQNGLKLSETDARGKVISESVVQPQEPGQKIVLSVDAAVTQGLYDALAVRAGSSKFQGGAGVIIDVKTGELLALTSYPEYSQNALESGDSATFKAFTNDSRRPFLNRATNGLYAPGSIVKPVVAIAALTENIIDPNKQLLSTGSISVPNPYDPAHPSVFRDWRAHGLVDMRHAIAVSSDVYFYEVGGGFPGQLGLGITNLDKYFKMFGFGQDAGLAGFSEAAGNIPTPTWKASTFPDDPTWRLGDTYHTAIGQYGMQVTPLQAARAAAAIANGGLLLTPTLLASLPTGQVGSTPAGVPITIPQSALQIVREGMRLGVVEGIAQAVKFDFVHVAAKTGTAQVGVHNEYVNSWMIGFWPYEHPRYAYAVVLERGPSGTLVGSPAVMGSFFLWMQKNAPQYLTSF